MGLFRPSNIQERPEAGQSDRYVVIRLSGQAKNDEPIIVVFWDGMKGEKDYQIGSN